jgi:Fe2+ or Zn2+ uptake regulation protein
VFDIDMLISKDMDKEAARETGFIVTHHMLEFHGLCNSCKG